MTTESGSTPDFWSADRKKTPKAAVDASAGIILANAEVSGTPEPAV
jgi:hypothetical protein